jgi:hypothetical protein
VPGDERRAYAPAWPELVVDIVQWTSVAGASGLIGAASSEGAKLVLRRMRLLWNRRKVDDREEADEVAYLAIFEASSSHGMPPTVWPVLELVSAEQLPDGTWVMRYGCGGDAAYEVRIYLVPRQATFAQSGPLRDTQSMQRSTPAPPLSLTFSR